VRRRQRDAMAGAFLILRRAPIGRSSRAPSRPTKLQSAREISVKRKG
jgi:hypothetical protein